MVEIYTVTLYFLVASIYNVIVILYGGKYMNTPKENNINGCVVEISSKQSNFTKQGSNNGGNTNSSLLKHIQNANVNNKNNKE